jgi:hypothetical protein
VTAVGTVTRVAGYLYEGGVVATATIGKLVKKTLMDKVKEKAKVARQAYDMAYEMNKTIRQIFAKVQITYSDPFFSAGIGTSATETGRYTYPDQTVDNVTEEAFKWFSLHRNTLDGSFHPLPGNQEYSVGWWGATLSNAVTALFTPGTQTLTITHAARTISSLQVIGDDQLGEYPVAFTVKLYTEGDVLVHTETVLANAAVTWSTALAPEHDDIVKQVLDITEWSRVSAVVKIAQFFTMLEEVYYSEDGELFDINVIEEREYEGQTIPQGNVSSSAITVRLNNIDYLFTDGNYHSRLAGLLLNNRAIKAWLGCDLESGQRIWFPLGTFYSRDWNAPEGETWAEVQGYDMLDRLKQTTFSTSEVYTNITLYDLAIVVMTDAGLTSEDWTIDATLDTADYTIPYAWFDQMSHREALRRIAAAALGQVYCDRDGKVVIEIYVAPTAQPYDFEFYTGNFFEINHPLEWSQMINSVEAKASPRVASAEQDITLDTETFTVPATSTVSKTHFFDFSPCVDVVDPLVFVNPGGNITLDSMTIYAWGVVAVYGNATGGDETVTSVTIRGKPLEVQGGRTTVAEDADSIASNGRQTLATPITSEFWQTETQSQAVADSLLASYKDPRRDAVLQARGNIALLLGDRVVAPDFKAEVTSEYSIMRQDINWDGGLSVGMNLQRIIDGHIIYHKTLEASVEATGTVVRRQNVRDGVVVATGVVVRKTMKALAAAVDAIGTVVRKTGKAITGTVAATGTVGRHIIRNKTVAGLVDAAGTVSRKWSFAMGSAAIDRATFIGGGSLQTWIDKSRPATHGGNIIAVDLYLAATGSGATGWKVCTFSGSGTDYTARDFAAMPALSLGLNQITSLSIDVEVGDFIGVVIPNNSGSIDRDVSGGSGVYWKAGDQSASGLQTYALQGATDSISVRGFSDIDS